MADKLPIWEQPLTPNSTLDEQVAHWDAVVGHYGTMGTVGRNAVKELAAAHAAQEAAAGPNGFGPDAAAAQAAADKANAPRQTAPKPTTLNLPTIGTATTSAASSSTQTPATSSKPAATTASTSGFNPFTPVTEASKAVAAQTPNGGFVGPQSDDQVKADWVNFYGPIASMALSTPWMTTILTNAINAKETADKFVQDIQRYVDPVTQQKPWDAIGQAVKDGQEAFYGNKTAWVQQYNDKLNILQKSAVAQGLDPSYFGSALDPADTEAVTKAFNDKSNPMNSYLSQYYNNTPDQGIVDNFVAQHATLMKNNNGGPQGAIATVATSLKNYASQYGVNSMFANPSWTGANSSGQSATVNQGADYWTNAALAIQSGYTNADSLQANIRNTAANIYKPFATQIQNGYSLADLAQPYMSAASNLLEVAPTSIDLGATSGVGYNLSKALQGDGTNPLSLDAFTKQVKSDPAWLQTTNARNSMMDTANTLLRNFGLVTGQQ
jgi:hypothetical protein